MPFIKEDKIKNIVVIQDYFYEEAYKLLKVETGISNFERLIKITYDINNFMHDHDLLWLSYELPYTWETKDKTTTVTQEELDWLNELRDLYLTMKNDK